MIRLDTARERWLSEQRYSPATKQTYRDTLRALETRQRQVGVTYLEQVSTDHLVAFLLYDPDGKATERAGSTLSRQRSTLLAFFSWAKRKGLVKVNPAEELRDMMLGNDRRREGKWLTRDERLAALGRCRDGTDNGLRDEAIVTLALLTGLRRAELANLTVKQLDLTEGRLVVFGKGGKPAVVGLPEEAKRALRAWFKRYKELRGRPPSASDPVFPSGHQRGGLGNSEVGYTFKWTKPLTKWAIFDIVSRRANCATHDLRRTFSQMLDDKGTPLQSIQAALRHSSPATTERCYLEKSPKRAIEAVRDLTL